MSQGKQDQKSSAPAAPADLSLASEAIKEVASYLRSDNMGIVASYASDDTTLRSIVRNTQGFFPQASDAYELLQAVVHGEPGNVVAMIRKKPDLLLQKVSSFTTPCKDVLFDVSPLQAILFYLDGDMLLHYVKPEIKDLPKEFQDKAYAQCLEMQGGGADLVNMARDPESFDNIKQFVEGGLTYPLLKNSNGIVFWNDRFFYVDLPTQTLKLVTPSIPPEQQKAFEAFKASFKAMEPNSSRRSSNNELEFIKLTMGVSLVRRGIHYQRGNMEYQDTEVSLDTITALRRYIRLFETYVYGTPWNIFLKPWQMIGQSQLQSIPMLQRMCEEKPFSPLPTEDQFKHDPFYRSLQFTSQGRVETLSFPQESGLGKNFTLIKGFERAFAAECVVGGGSAMAWHVEMVRFGLAAYCRIEKVAKDCVTEFVMELRQAKQASDSSDCGVSANLTSSTS